VIFGQPITVWRGQTFQAETASPMNGAALDCAGCAGGKRVGFISGDVEINKVVATSAGSHTVVIYYTNGDAAPRTMAMSIGGTKQAVSFPSTGDWGKVGMVRVTSGGFVQGNANSVLFALVAGYNPPDLDWIEVQ